MVNLLPHRQQQIKTSKRNFWFGLGVSLLFTCCIAFILKMILQQEIRTTNKQINFYKQRLKTQPKKTSNVAFKKLIQQSEQLAKIQKHQQQALQLLLDIAAKTSPQITLLRIQTEAQNLLLSGIAKQHVAATKYLSTLKQIPYLTQMKLREINTNKVINFSITGTIK